MNFRIALLLALLLGAFLVISVNGLKFGIDFKGGTQFQVQLQEPAKNANELSQIVSVFSRRLDWTGLKDTKVTSLGDEVILVQIAETDPEQIDLIESRLRRQGKFEATLDGNVLFTGDEIAHIFKQADKGYGFIQEGDGIMWRLPFMLKDSAAERFTRMTFHKCTIVSQDPGAGKQYECEKTYFFIDRPADAVLVIPQSVFSNDRGLLLQGNQFLGIPAETSMAELLQNSGIPHFTFTGSLEEAQLQGLSVLAEENPNALVPLGTNEEVIAELKELGFQVTERGVEPETPWVWKVTGIQQVISLSEDVTGLDPFVESVEQAERHSELVIRGFAPDPEQAMKELNDLTILLESGSLPIPVKEISRETVSPTLGKAFLQNAALMGFVALLVVVLVIFIRYRVLKLVFPIMFAGLSEVVLILGFASLISWNLDLAAVAGIIAAVGTGVDHQIIISDELVRGVRTQTGSFAGRLKKAFFIIFAAAATTIATMAPIILFGFGLGKLVGFAITTISGVLIGIFITRPAYGEMARMLLSR